MEDISIKLKIFRSDRKKRPNSVDRWKKTMPEIYLLNASKFDLEESLFDFYLDSIAIRIRILMNVTLF